MYLIYLFIYFPSSFFKQIKYLTSLKTSRYLPLHELEKRLNHTEKERVRRDEMRQYFVALKKALNVEERVKMCNHDILNQVSNTHKDIRGISNILRTPILR